MVIETGALYTDFTVVFCPLLASARYMYVYHCYSSEIDWSLRFKKGLFQYFSSFLQQFIESKGPKSSLPKYLIQIVNKYGKGYTLDKPYRRMFSEMGSRHITDTVKKETLNNVATSGAGACSMHTESQVVYSVGLIGQPLSPLLK